MFIILNSAEMQQANALVNAIRSDLPNRPRPARDYVPLVRGRVCAWLNQQIETGYIHDINVDRTQKVDLYFHM